jgi:hypothetical protein
VLIVDEDMDEAITGPILILIRFLLEHATIAVSKVIEPILAQIQIILPIFLNTLGVANKVMDQMRVLIKLKLQSKTKNRVNATIDDLLGEIGQLSIHSLKTKLSDYPIQN